MFRGMYHKGPNIYIKKKDILIRRKREEGEERGKFAVDRVIVLPEECPIYDPQDSKRCTYVSITTNGDDARVHKDNGNYPFKHTRIHTHKHSHTYKRIYTHSEIELNKSRLYSLHT